MRRIAGLLILLVSAGCGQATPPATSTPASASMEVTAYRGDTARTGQMPGPGPGDSPVERWHYQASAAIESSPVVVGGRVIVVAIDGSTTGLDLERGTVDWQASLGAEVRGSPAVVAGVLVIGDANGGLHGLDPATGADAWTTTLSGPIAGSVAAAGSTILAATASGSASGVDAKTGRVVWTHDLPGPVTRSVAVGPDLAYVGVTPGLLVAFHPADGSIAWSTQLTDEGDVTTPTVANGLVYAASGVSVEAPLAKVVFAADAATGAVRWHYASPAHEEVYTPAVVDGGAYVVSKDTSVTRLDAATGSSVWTAAGDTPIEAGAAICDGRVYVASNAGSLRALDARDGRTIWQLPQKGVPFAPVVVGGRVLIGSSVGLLTAVGVPAQ